MIAATRTAAGLAGLLTLAAPALAEWAPFASPGDGFTVDFPAAPEVTARNDDITLVSDTLYTVATPTTVAQVQAVRFFQAPAGDPPGLDLFRGVLRAAACSADGLATESIGAAVAHSRSGLCQGGAYGFAHRMVFAGDRAWLIVYAGPPGTEASPEAKRFLASFRLTAR
ncbi:MAG: hypothetical protein U1E56_07615 [Bauldia sp.]